ncbi:MAG: hypothetical protein AB4911_05520 [Oscillochloridaceae bacterium umkhey_bin13]
MSDAIPDPTYDRALADAAYTVLAHKAGPLHLLTILTQIQALSPELIDNQTPQLTLSTALNRDERFVRRGSTNEWSLVGMPDLTDPQGDAEADDDTSELSTQDLVASQLREAPRSTVDGPGSTDGANSVDAASTVDQTSPIDKQNTASSLPADAPSLVATPSSADAPSLVDEPSTASSIPADAPRSASTSLLVPTPSPADAPSLVDGPSADPSLLADAPTFVDGPSADPSLPADGSPFAHTSLSVTAPSAADAPSLVDAPSAVISIVADPPGAAETEAAADVLPHVPDLDQRLHLLGASLLIEPSIVRRIYRSLLAGRHVVLSGPPVPARPSLPACCRRCCGPMNCITVMPHFWLPQPKIGAFVM